MNSEIFEFTFDYDEWPTSHKNKHECIRAYNGSIFNLRDSYKIVFPEKCYKIIDMYAHDHSEPDGKDTSKIYKIKYQINLLATIGEHKIEDPDDPNSYIWINYGNSLMRLVADSEEMEIFNSEKFNHLIEYKWNQYGQKHHLFGSFMHAVYTFSMIVYIFKVYLYPIEIEYHFYWTMLLFLGICYPWGYDFIQLVKDGPKAYFSDPWNYLDFVYIYGSLVNVYL